MGRDQCASVVSGSMTPPTWVHRSLKCLDHSLGYLFEKHDRLLTERPRGKEPECPCHNWYGGNPFVCPSHPRCDTLTGQLSLRRAREGPLFPLAVVPVGRGLKQLVKSYTTRLCGGRTRTSSAPAGTMFQLHAAREHILWKVRSYQGDTPHFFFWARAPCTKLNSGQQEHDTSSSLEIDHLRVLALTSMSP